MLIQSMIAEYLNIKYNIKIMFEWIKKVTNPQIRGDYSFHLQTTPSVIDTSSTLTVTAFTSSTSSQTVPCQFRWFRTRNGVSSQVHKWKGNIFLCGVEDVGAKIWVEVQSLEGEFSGKAIVEWPVVLIEPTSKKEIQNTLACRSALINAYLCWNQQEAECQIKIFQDIIKICHTSSEANFTFQYWMSNPRIQLFPKQITKISLGFCQRSQEAEHFFCDIFRLKPMNRPHQLSRQFRLDFKFKNRTLRDNFILIIKAFYTKRQLKNSAVIKKIQSIDFKENGKFDSIIEIEATKSDLLKALQSYKKVQLEKNRYKGEVQRLEKQIQQIILTYTKIVEEKCQNMQQFNKSFSMLQNKREQVYGKKYKFLQNENNSLNQRLRTLTNEIDQIRYNASMKKVQATAPRTPYNEEYFSKKKQPQKNHINLQKILDDLSESRVRQFSDESLYVKSELELIKEQKKDLQRKLDKSLKSIQNLQKQLDSEKCLQKVPTAVNIRYGSPYGLNDERQGMSMQLERLKRENNNLAKANKSLHNENNHLNAEISISSSRFIVKKTESTANLLSKGQIQKLEMENQQLKRDKFLLENKIADLMKQKESLKNQNHEKLYHEQRLNKKIHELQNEVSLHRKNQEVLNRSQYISLEMSQHHEEQFNILKEQNEFLTTENEKLIKACERYMNDAKQLTRMTQENIQLKQKLNRRLINPQQSSIIS